MNFKNGKSGLQNPLSNSLNMSAIKFRVILKDNPSSSRKAGHQDVLKITPLSAKGGCCLEDSEGQKYNSK